MYKVYLVNYSYKLYLFDTEEYKSILYLLFVLFFFLDLQKLVFVVSALISVLTKRLFPHSHVFQVSGNTVFWFHFRGVIAFVFPNKSFKVDN